MYSLGLLMREVPPTVPLVAASAGCTASTSRLLLRVKAAHQGLRGFMGFPKIGDPNVVP